MKILIYHWNSYNQKDVEEAFVKTGNYITILERKTENIEEDMAYVYTVTDMLEQQKPDMLFSVNFFPVLAQACHETGIPYVCWNCDSPLLAMYNNAVFYNTNFIFTFDRSNYEEFKNLGVNHIYHLPLAANTEHFKNILKCNNTDIVLSKYDISFIGSMYENNSFDRIASSLPDYLCGYFDGALYAQLHVSGGNILEKLLTHDICRQLEEITDYRKSPDSFADIRTLFSTTVLGFKAASMQREFYLNSLAAYLQKTLSNKHKCFLHLFTGSNTDLLPFIKCHGKVDYNTEMPVIFRQSKINLNMTIPNIKTGIPLRVWDILSCGGFLMTDFRIELMDFFIPGEDIVVFEDAYELEDKAGFYLSHDTIRNKIAQNAYNKISKGHTCQNRIENILQTISKEI